MGMDTGSPLSKNKLLVKVSGLDIVQACENDFLKEIVYYLNSD